MVQRYGPWLAAALVLAGLAAFLAIRQMLPAWVERALTEAAWAEGLTGAQISLEALTMHEAAGILLLDARCAPGCRARFTAGYSLGGLWDRRVDQLSFRDISLTGWSVDGVGRPGPTRWDLPPFQLRDIALPLPENPLMPAGATLTEATLTPSASGGWQCQGRGQLIAGDTVLAGLDFTLAFSPNQPAELNIVATPTGHGPVANGTLHLRFPPDAMPEGEGSLQLENLTFWGLSPLRISLTGRSSAKAGLALEGGLDLPAGPGATGLLRAGHISLSLKGNITQLQGSLTAEGVGINNGPPDNHGTMPLRLNRGAAGWQAESTDGGTLFLPALGVAIQGLTLTAPAENGGIMLAAESLHLGGPNPLLVPVRPLLRLEQGAEGRWLAQLTAPDLAGQPLLKGEADWKAGAGYRLMLEIPTQTLGPDGRSLDELSPWLGQWLKDARGQIGLRLTHAQDSAGTTAAAHLLLDQAGFSWGGGRLEGLSGRLWFDTLSPLAMPPQNLWIGRLTTDGMVLDGGMVTVELPGDGQLLVGPATPRWGGLALQMAQTRFPLGGPPPPLMLNLPPTPVGEVLAVLGVTPLLAEGTVTGRINLPLDTKPLPHGGISATQPGWISWQGGDAPDFLDPDQTDSPALVAAALRNYQFQRLIITPGTKGPLLRLEGANPDLYGGYPMGLNLHLRPRE